MRSPHKYTYVRHDEIKDENHLGQNRAFWVTHVSYGKEAVYSKDSPSPYLLGNEWICNSLASFLRLPTPPFAIMNGGHSAPLFTMLQFTPTSDPPPDTIARQCWNHHPDLCVGIFLLDLLVLNNDRYSRNLYVDDPYRPKEVIVYDYDTALAGAMYDEAEKALTTRRDAFLGHHMFRRLIDSESHFPQWYKRIQSIPKWYLTDICNEAREFAGFSKRIADKCRQFLEHRQANLTTILGRNREKLEAIKSWSTLPI